MKRLLAVLLLCGSAIAPLQATVPDVDIYVAQNTQGGDTGADAADAHSLAWLNTPGNWGPGSNQVAPGTTVHLVGILTNTLTVYGSGTAGNPITIYFESNAMFSAPTLPVNSIWINIKGSTWITIDGGVNGAIQLTDNGTVTANGGTMDYGNGGIIGINAFGDNNLTIQNLVISNMFNRQTNSEPPVPYGDGTGIYWLGSGLTVSNCTITGCASAILGVYGAPTVGSNLVVASCTVTNCNHGIVLGGSDTNFYNVSITHNVVSLGDMFQSTDTPAFSYALTNGTNSAITTATAVQLAPAGTPPWWQPATNLLTQFYWNPSQTWTNPVNTVITGCYTNAAMDAIAFDTNGNGYAGLLPLDLISGLFTNMWFSNYNGYWNPYYTPDSSFHRDPIFLYNTDAVGCVSNILIAGNFITVGVNPLSTSAGTGAIFFNAGGFNFAHVRVYNNISTLAQGMSWSGGNSGGISAFGLDVLVANNTMVFWQTNGNYGTGGYFSVGGSNYYAYNNIVCSGDGVWATAWYYAGGLPNTLATAAQAFSGVTLDYNIYNGQQSYPYVHFVESVYTNNSAVLYQAYQPTFNGFTNIFNPANGFNWDVHSLTSTVQLDANFTPLAGDTVANGNGTNLTAWGITNDYAGNARPTNGNWTIGAYQIAAGTINNSPNLTNSASAGPVGGSSGGGSSGGGGSGSSGGTAPPAAGIASIVPGGGSDITNGLILQYKFNQTSGITATDSSGNGYTGSLTGAASWTNGFAGTQAILFSSNSDVVCSMSYSGDWTVTSWVYPISFPGTSDYAWSTTGTTGLCIGPGAWNFYGDGASVQGTSPLNSNAWYFLAVSKSSGTNYQLYLNGAANASGVLANINMMFVEVGNNGYSQYMNGMVEDFRIYNRVLSPGEISTLAVNGPDDIALTMLSPPTNLRLIPAGP